MATSIYKDIIVILIAAGVGIVTIRLYTVYASTDNGNERQEASRSQAPERNFAEVRSASQAKPATLAPDDEIAQRLARIERQLAGESRAIQPSRSSEGAGPANASTKIAVAASEPLKKSEQVEQLIAEITTSLSSRKPSELWPEPGLSMWHRTLTIYKTKKLSQTENKLLLAVIDSIFRSAYQVLDSEEPGLTDKSKLLMIGELKTANRIVGQSQMAALDATEARIRMRRPPN